MAGNDHAPVTVIGLGLMGQALAGAFLKAGHPTTVWNRSADKAQELVGQGAVLAASPAEAVAASELVVVCVSDYDAMHSVLDPLGSALSGKALVNLTSGSSEQAREKAGWAAGHGASYLDGAIMTVPALIGGAETVLFYSGPADVFAAHEATLKVLGGNTTHLGADHALAALYDVSLLGVMWGTLNSFLHGVALLDTVGVKASEFLPWATAWVDAVKGFATDYAGQIDAADGKFPANDATMEVHAGALEHLVHESEAQGINPELPLFVQGLMARTIAAGHGKNSYASMVKVFQQPKA
ncbi:NAD(P)-dependent oxidoreductase [Streptomyces sp. L500]|uniref:NAD(P)-dependent oxidoreductase n=1 Tax=Streptomyces abikoensis TaxID=97398 RepID=UPI001675D327|nr:NAD(P)-binding domain-containing protein [Streptomyces abikoensis]GGP72080.1 3-hydroxyisobutyrate dehydrogenase [Streptomyces abikoensis]